MTGGISNSDGPPDVSPANDAALDGLAKSHRASRPQHALCLLTGDRNEGLGVAFVMVGTISDRVLLRGVSSQAPPRR